MFQSPTYFSRESFAKEYLYKMSQKSQDFFFDNFDFEHYFSHQENKNFVIKPNISYFR